MSRAPRELAKLWPKVLERLHNRLTSLLAEYGPMIGHWIRSSAAETHFQHLNRNGQMHGVERTHTRPHFKTVIQREKRKTLSWNRICGTQMHSRFGISCTTTKRGSYWSFLNNLPGQWEMNGVSVSLNL